jgi:hypothetical protein
MKLDPGLRVLLMILAALIGVAILLGVWALLLAPPGFEPAVYISE